MASKKKSAPAQSEKDRIAHLFESNKGVRIDLGCGANKQPGFLGVDFRQLPGVDIVQDLEKFPWKDIPDEVASVVMTSHVIEHINPAGGTFMAFMDEVWRITKPGGQFLSTMPYAGSPGYWQDPTHCNGCTEITWAYFDPLARDPHGNFYHLYTIYRPLPWEIVGNVSFDVNGGLEVLLRKRKIDKSYHTAVDFKNTNKKII